jgi:hypothetical protein
MKVAQVVVLCAALCVGGATVTAAQGRGGLKTTIAASIAKTPRLEAKLKRMLPAGMTMEQASDGFRNQGQFIAALEASKNNKIDFVRLKAEMTGDDALSLGQAVRKLKK